MNVQDMVSALQRYWAAQGCAILQPYDKEVGAGTFHPATFLRCLGSDPWKAVYVQPCRRPTDGRYGENPNRLQHYYQLQVVIKPSVANIQQLYLDSLTEALKLDASVHDVRFIEDNWEAPSLGAWGTGWEIWLNGMEITQFTYFQQSGGVQCSPITVELTYGLERLAMYLQQVENVYDLRWSDDVCYDDLFLRNEKEQSIYNFEKSDVVGLQHKFDKAIECAQQLVQDNLALPAYDAVMEASHTFNLLMARRVLSVAQRQEMVLSIRKQSRAVSLTWLGEASE